MKYDPCSSGYRNVLESVWRKCIAYISINIERQIIKSKPIFKSVGSFVRFVGVTKNLEWAWKIVLQIDRNAQDNKKKLRKSKH